MRLLVAADTHLSTRTPEASANWVAATGAAGGCDLLVHAGDLTLDGAHGDADLLLARGHLDALPVPWVAVPGNHDVGDPSRSGRVEAWRGVVGPAAWSTLVGGWTLVGVDAQALGARPAALEHALAAIASAPGPVALITHKPLHARPEEVAAAPAARFVPEPARSALHDALQAAGGVVVSGHVHQHRQVRSGSVLHVWAPSSWAVLPEEVQATVATKRCGVVVVDLHPDGTATAELVEPAGLHQHVVGGDLPNPYRTR